MELWDLVILGAGAAGLACAISAAESAPHKKILVLEKMDRVGKKILATGNGRCNLTNTAVRPQAYRTGDPQLLEQALTRMPTALVTDFFEELGLLCRIQPDGLVYPNCNQAAVVLDCLRDRMDYLQIPVECSCEIVSIRREKGLFALTAKDGRRFSAKKVAIACGGKSSSKLGSAGGGYLLAKEMGHHVTALTPGLTGLPCPSLTAGLKGIRALGTATLYDGKKEIRREPGEIQFAEKSLSGIPMFQLSTYMVPERRYHVALDLLPQLSDKEVFTLLMKRCYSPMYPTAETLLQGILSKRLGYAVLKDSGISPLSLPNKSLGKAQISALVRCLKHWELPVQCPTAWDNAQITVGGVPLKEISVEDFSSKTCPGLYLLGELLDVSGDCGGYNLHWAFSTGILAGRRMMEKKK